MPYRQLNRYHLIIGFRSEVADEPNNSLFHQVHEGCMPKPALDLHNSNLALESALVNISYPFALLSNSLLTQ